VLAFEEAIQGKSPASLSPEGCSTCVEAFMGQAKGARTKFEHANPILSVADMTRSLRYYVDVLGFANAEWGGDDFTCVTRDGASIYLSEGDQGNPGTWVWLGVDDVEDLYREYRESGAQILEPPRNYPWACEMRVGDPDGHVLRFGSDPKG
jgi:predicted enzyme related to lactoylglutathione lyase